MPTAGSDLEDALSRLLPLEHQLAPLALAHVTIGRHLSRIIERHELLPRECRTFNEDVLYFSYGAPYYKPSTKLTEDALEFPVAIILEPDVQSYVGCYYPFDTGAVSSGLFGKEWQCELTGLDRFRVSKQPEDIVYALYENNENYLRGRVRQEPIGGEPLLLLHRFLSQNLARQGIDQRQRTVECLVRRALNLSNCILWIGYPDVFAPQIGKLWRNCRKKFKSTAYATDMRDDPAALVSLLNRISREHLGYLHRPPGAADP